MLAYLLWWWLILNLIFCSKWYFWSFGKKWLLYLWITPGPKTILFSSTGRHKKQQILQSNNSLHLFQEIGKLLPGRENLTFFRKFGSVSPHTILIIILCSCLCLSFNWGSSQGQGHVAEPENCIIIALDTMGNMTEKLAMLGRSMKRLSYITSLINVGGIAHLFDTSNFMKYLKWQSDNCWTRSTWK